MAATDIAKLFDLSGQVACLTGGASGMGRSTGIVLAQAGATVILADINEAGLEETARFIEDTGGKASTVRCDVTNEAEVEALVAKAVADHGRLDIMGNIAGIPQQSLIVDTSEQMMDDLFAINLKGVFFGVKHAMKAMIPQKSGNIVNVSSGHHRQPRHRDLVPLRHVEGRGRHARQDRGQGGRPSRDPRQHHRPRHGDHRLHRASLARRRGATRFPGARMPSSRPPRNAAPSVSPATPTTSPTPSSISSPRPASSSRGRSSTPTAASPCPGSPDLPSGGVAKPPSLRGMRPAHTHGYGPLAAENRAAHGQWGWGQLKGTRRTEAILL